MMDVTTHEIELEPALERKLYRCCPIEVKDLPEGVENEFTKELAKEWL